jgi:glyoxylate/hydroxypyruvate reductase A
MAILMMNPLRATPELWKDALAKALPKEDIRFWPEVGNPADIEVLIVGLPKLKELPKLPNLKLTVSLLAGVDAMIEDPDLPNVALVKVEPPTGDRMMTEYALSLVLYHHRNIPLYRINQAKHTWEGLPHKRAEDRTVGLLGYGTLSKPMADKIKGNGFKVAAWARTPKPDADIEVFVGADGFGPFLARTEIAVCMLPLTPETKGILNAKAFAQMPKGASVVNLGRGPHVVNADLIAALDAGQLGAATLDVTDPEPLPADHPLWDHPAVTIMPHVARRPTLAETIPQIVENLRRLRANEPLILLVNRNAGY